MSIRSRRNKPRPGRLDAKGMEALRRERFEMDRYRCQQVVATQRFTVLGIDHEIDIKCLAPVTWETGELAHKGSKRRHGDSIENTFTSCKDCHRKYHAYGPSMTKPVPCKAGE